VILTVHHRHCSAWPGKFVGGLLAVRLWDSVTFRPVKFTGSRQLVFSMMTGPLLPPSRCSPEGPTTLSSAVLRMVVSTRLAMRKTAGPFAVEGSCSSVSVSATSSPGESVVAYLSFRGRLTSSRSGRRNSNVDEGCRFYLSRLFRKMAGPLSPGP
jgi:hypothetical protein